MSNETERAFDPERDVSEKYVAFCDILGFSDKVLTSFVDTLETYRQFADLVAKFPLTDVEITVYSDAVLVVSSSLAPLLQAVQGLWFYALSHDLMLRGAITKGRYWELQKGKHLFVASDALVRAVRLEKSIGVPAIFIADDIDIPFEYWVSRFQQGLFITPILHFRDRNIVNPFNLYWFKSAKLRANRLMEQSPAHRDKYLWFIALHDAVNNNEELVPLPVIERLVNEGVLMKRVQIEPRKQ